MSRLKFLTLPLKWARLCNPLKHESLVTDHFGFTKHGQIISENQSGESFIPESLYSSWYDLYNLLNSLPKDTHIVDIGAGEARLAFLASQFFPNVKVTSIESKIDRMKLCREKIGPNPSIKFLEMNVLDEEFKLPIADFYYLYFPTGPALEKIIFQLNQFDTPWTLLAVESHGDLFDRLDFSLTQFDSKKLLSPRHHPDLRYYRKSKLKDNPIQSYLEASILNRNCFIQLNSGKIMSLKHCWYQAETGHIVLSHPPNRWIRPEEIECFLPHSELLDRLHLPCVFRHNDQIVSAPYLQSIQLNPPRIEVNSRFYELSTIDFIS